jgi:hypothetical protein
MRIESAGKLGRVEVVIDQFEDRPFSRYTPRQNMPRNQRFRSVIRELLGKTMIWLLLFAASEAQAQSFNYFRRSNPGPIAVPVPSKKDGAGNSYELVPYQARLESVFYAILK